MTIQFIPFYEKELDIVLNKTFKFILFEFVANSAAFGTATSKSAGVIVCNISFSWHSWK